mmetsp:Transcript_18847/g.58639  ORF Transcript_18847/g.58639 Transcript_18847/m.58639 type:complete len:293 (-) Transcript_18847:1149-2027(-)
MPSVDRHAVRAHCKLDLIDDGGPRSFDAQRLLRLHDVVCLGLLAQHTLGAHDLGHIVALHQQVVPALVLVDDRALHAGNAAHDDPRQRCAQRLQPEEGVTRQSPSSRVISRLACGAPARRAARAVHQHQEGVAADNLDLIFVNLELWGLEHLVLDAENIDAQLQFSDGVHVEPNLDVAAPLEQHRAHRGGHVAQRRLLNSRLDHARGRLVLVVEQLDTDNGRRDVLRGVDDLLDARHTQRHVHRRNARKVKGLERHLSTRFADRLCAHRAHRAARLNALARQLAHAAQAEAR